VPRSQPTDPLWLLSARADRLFHEGAALKLLSLMARSSAILAGVLLTVITLITCGSLIGRNTIGLTLVGDYELTAFTAGAAIALFLPWAQLKRENIIVDFFTSKASTGSVVWMDRFGALLLALLMLLLTWRTTVGGMSAYDTQTTSMMLGFPEWIVYVFMVPPFLLTAVIALYQAFVGDFPEQGE
jgi:TRAP-type C4-dicarboxylate transport system permease small subunit